MERERKSQYDLTRTGSEDRQSTGGREFVMPMPGATPWVYTPDMVKDLSQLDYVYDDLIGGCFGAARQRTYPKVE